MNVWGKVFAFLVIIAATASTFLTAKLIQVRNSWAAKSTKFEKAYEPLVASLKKSRAEFNQLRDERFDLEQAWGASFTVDTQISDPATGRLQVDAGTNIGLQPQMVVHGFQILPGDQSIYRGPFVVTAAQAVQSAVDPTWRLRPEDIQGGGNDPAWQNGQWRWRTMIPSAYSVQFDNQLLAFMKAKETLDERQHSVDVQNRLVEEARKQLQVRVAELVGGPELPQDESLNPEDREGLVGPLETEEEARNKALLEIARLRRAVRAERDRVLELQAENQKLAQRLPQPGPAVSSSLTSK